MSKGELLRAYLEQRGVRIPHSFGWRKVSCFNDAGHARGDRNPSASVNLTTGRYKCFSCGLSGDVFDLMKIESGLSYGAARATLGVDAPRVEEPTWL